jgi:hypothetical protein
MMIMKHAFEEAMLSYLSAQLNAAWVQLLDQKVKMRRQMSKMCSALKMWQQVESRTSSS